MFDPRTIKMFLSAILLLHLSSAFYLMEDRYKKKVDQYEEVETITDPAKVKLLMSHPAKEEVKFTPVLISDKFSKYDSIVHDGHITLRELIKTTGAERNAKNAFQAADKDADGEISQEEFKIAPWAMKPTFEDSKDDEEYINVTVEEEEIEADKVGRDDEGGEDVAEEEMEEEDDDDEDEEEVDEEGSAEKVGEDEKGGEQKEGESLVGNVVKKVEVRGENERREEEGDEIVIIEKDEIEGLEEAEGGVESVGKEGKVGEGGGEEGEKATEKKIVEGVDRKVEVGEESKEGEIEKSTEKKIVKPVEGEGKGGEAGKKIVGGAKPVGEERKVGGEGEEGAIEKKIVGGVKPVGEESKVGGGEGEATEKHIIGVERKVEVGGGVMGKIENTEQARNESGGVGEEKVGESIEKEENGEDEEKDKEEKSEGADNKAEIEDKEDQEEYIEIEDLEPHLLDSTIETLMDSGKF